MGVYCAYGSYLPRKSDITNNAFITGFADTGFAFLSGLAVFSILGFMSTQSGVPFTEVVTQSIGLAFVAFPQGIGMMPVVPWLFGLLFFGCLLFGGLTSSISMVESFFGRYHRQNGVQPQAVVTWTCFLGWLVSMVFATGAGLYILDIVDHFINAYGVVLAGLARGSCHWLVPWPRETQAAFQCHFGFQNWSMVGFSDKILGAAHYDCYGACEFRR